MKGSGSSSRQMTFTRQPYITNQTSAQEKAVQIQKDKSLDKTTIFDRVTKNCEEWSSPDRDFLTKKPSGFFLSDLKTLSFTQGRRRKRHRFCASFVFFSG